MPNYYSGVALGGPIHGQSWTRPEPVLVVLEKGESWSVPPDQGPPPDMEYHRYTHHVVPTPDGGHVGVWLHDPLTLDGVVGALVQAMEADPELEKKIEF